MREVGLNERRGLAACCCPTCLGSLAASMRACHPPLPLAHDAACCFGLRFARGLGDAFGCSPPCAARQPTPRSIGGIGARAASLGRDWTLAVRWPGQKPRGGANKGVGRGGEGGGGGVQQGILAALVSESDPKSQRKRTDRAPVATAASAAAPLPLRGGGPAGGVSAGRWGAHRLDGSLLCPRRSVLVMPGMGNQTPPWTIPNIGWNETCQELLLVPRFPAPCAAARPSSRHSPRRSITPCSPLSASLSSPRLAGGYEALLRCAPRRCVG